MTHGFQYHEHTADITVECWGSTLEEAFEEAAVATLEVILDTSTVEPNESVTIEVSGIDLNELLVEWIGQIIALIDTEMKFFSKFKIEKLETCAEGFSLVGKAMGEPINLEKHDVRTEVKAMTYADLMIDKGPEKISIWFTLDL